MKVRRYILDMTSKNVEIERASQEGDVAAYDLLVKQLEEHHVDIPADELLNAILVLLGDEDLGFILLAWDEGKATGVACVSIMWTLEHGGKSAWLEELYLLPEFRGRGVGTGLLEMVFTECRKLSCAAVDLEVEWEHVRAENLYRRHDFIPLPRNRWVKILNS